jgi:diacylglycerol kinase family enzyme
MRRFVEQADRVRGTLFLGSPEDWISGAYKLIEHSHARSIDLGQRRVGR